MKHTDLQEGQVCIINKGWDGATFIQPVKHRGEKIWTDTTWSGHLAIFHPATKTFVLLTGNPGMRLFQLYDVTPVENWKLVAFVKQLGSEDVACQDASQDLDLQEDKEDQEKPEDEEELDNLLNTDEPADEPIEQSRCYWLADGREVRIDEAVRVVVKDGFHVVLKQDGSCYYVPFGPGINTVLFVEPN